MGETFHAPAYIKLGMNCECSLNPTHKHQNIQHFYTFPLYLLQNSSFKIITKWI